MMWLFAKLNPVLLSYLTNTYNALPSSVEHRARHSSTNITNTNSNPLVPCEASIAVSTISQMRI